MPVQLRNEEGAIWETADVKSAFEAAHDDKSIWKISWQEGDHRIRLVRAIHGSPLWSYEPIPIPDEVIRHRLEMERITNWDPDDDISLGSKGTPGE